MDDFDLGLLVRRLLLRAARERMSSILMEHDGNDDGDDAWDDRLTHLIIILACSFVFLLVLCCIYRMTPTTR